MRVNAAVEEHMPSLYRAAEDASVRGQDRFRKLTAISLWLLIVAAIGGLIEHDWAGWLSLAAFGASMVTTGLWVFRRAETDSYDGRAAAESVKSLTSKYAVRGEPFDVSDAEASELVFRAAIDGLVNELVKLQAIFARPPPPAKRRIRRGALGATCR